MAKHTIDAFHTDKLRGELAELAFMYRATSEGITVAKPYGDSHAYDFLVQYNCPLSRIQVKSTFLPPHGRCSGYQVIVARRVAKKDAFYTKSEVDFMVVFLAPCDVWYVIPVENLAPRRIIYLYPEGTKMPFGGMYEDYRGKWGLLKDEQQAAENSAPDQNPSTSGLQGSRQPTNLGVDKVGQFN